MSVMAINNKQILVYTGKLVVNEASDLCYSEHIHGHLIGEDVATITTEINGKKIITEKTFPLFLLNDGRQFYSFELDDAKISWGYYSGYYDTDPECCIKVGEEQL